MPAIIAHKKLRQEYCQFKPSLGYTMSTTPMRSYKGGGEEKWRETEESFQRKTQEEKESAGYGYSEDRGGAPTA